MPLSNGVKVTVVQGGGKGRGSRFLSLTLVVAVPCGGCS